MPGNARFDIAPVPLAAPQIAIAGQPRRHQAQPAARLGTGLRKTACIGVAQQGRIDIVRGAVHVDPGPRRGRHDYRKSGLLHIARQQIGIAVLQPHERGCRQAEIVGQRGGVGARRVRHRDQHRKPQAVGTRQAIAAPRRVGQIVFTEIVQKTLPPLENVNVFRL